MIRGAPTPDHPNTRKCASMTIYSKKQDDYNKNPRFCKHCEQKIPYEKWRRKTNKHAILMFCDVVCHREYRRLVVGYGKILKKCKQCEEIISFENRNNTFCGSSCAAIYNNTGRIRSEDSKRRMSEKMGGCIYSRTLRRRSYMMLGKRLGIDVSGPFSAIYEHTCKICGEVRLVPYRVYKRNKTCGKRECVSEAICTNMIRRKNSVKRSVKYFNPCEQREVVLDSSWEVRIADLLIEKNIKWIRPKPMGWVDSTGKERLYFPDFYLPEHALYLDPKNPRCMEQDREKMAAVSLLVNIEYGHIDKIVSVIELLLPVPAAAF